MQPEKGDEVQDSAPHRENEIEAGQSGSPETAGNEAQPAPEGQWAFHAEDGAQAETLPPAPINPVSWSASEYIAHHKSAGWFASLGLAIAVLTLAIYLITRDLVSPIMIAIIGIAFGVFAARQPQVLDYSLDERGLQAGHKLYQYDRFKSFSIIHDGAVSSILLMPLQRFMPPLSIYYDPSDEDKILQVIGNYLPNEDRSHDMVDRLMRKIRF